MLADVFHGRIRAALDIACGDGAYADWLSRRFGIPVVGLDTNFSFLRLARRRPIRRQESLQVLSLAGNALMLPFADESFDAVWCAQSLYSLPDPTTVLKEMRRVTRPGGTAAVLENDTLHEVILPWPPDLELAIRQAEWASFCGERSDPEKLYLGRYLPEAFHSAGFSSCSLKTHAVSRVAPIDEDVREYLQGYLSRLRERAAPYLSAQHLECFDRLLDHGGTNSLIDRADFNFTCLNYVAAATKPLS
jgi:SAM-dependent methyltransferase